MQIEAHSGSCILDQRRMAVYFLGDCMNNVACGCMRETVTQILYEAGGGLASGPLDLSQSMWGRGAAKEAAQALCSGRTLTPPPPLFQAPAI